MKISFTVLIHKNLLSWFVKRTISLSPWQFFSDLTENMAKERSNTTQVFIFFVRFFWVTKSISLSTWFFKKFNDFPEIATEAFSSYTKEENGKTVPMWTKQEVEDIVAAQVRFHSLQSSSH